MEVRKKVLGQFFTKDELWLKPQIIDFINQTGCNIAYDPFAGAGDLLKASKTICNINDIIGLDIDPNLGWEVNDSLIGIPHFDNAVIITNPPYISNYSASRKGIGKELKKYFSTSNYTDIYMIALDQMLLAQKNVVAIIPETFINSSYQQKNLLNSVTILEENPFDDTENPVIVACFDGVHKNLSEVKVYKNDQFINSLGNIDGMRPKPRGSLHMTFNDPNGWLAIRCIDTTNPDDMIRFDTKENINYDWEKRIKTSSRLLTLVELNVPYKDRCSFISECNELLFKMRIETDDVILSPFKGNMKDGRRRRRLDFITCRAIIEEAYNVFYHIDGKLPINTIPDIESKMQEREIYAQQQALF